MHNHFFCDSVIGCTVNDYWLWKYYYDVMGNITGFGEWQKKLFSYKNGIFTKYIICSLRCSIKTEGKWFLISDIVD